MYYNDQDTCRVKRNVIRGLWLRADENKMSIQRLKMNII